MAAKLNGTMDLEQIIMTMAEGNIEAQEVASIMMRDRNLHMGVIVCDKYDIRGDKLVKLYYHCCDGRNEKMDKTLEMLKAGVYSEEDIDRNLSHPTPEDFLDEGIVSYHIPLYSEEFKLGHPNWDEFAYLQRRNFHLKLKRKEAIEKIPEWVVQGQTMMYPEKYAKWETCVIERATDFSNGLILKNALEIMATLENGASIEEAKQVLANQGHSGGTELDVRNIVLQFSNRGPDFYLSTLTMELSVEQKSRVGQIIRENAMLEEKYNNKGQNNNLN